jgi:hypothetical protein
MADTPTYQTSAWRNKTQYICPCGYTTFDRAKMEAHVAVCVLPHFALPEEVASPAPQESAPRAAPHVTRAAGTPATKREG